MAKRQLFLKPKQELERLVRWGPRGYFRSGAWAREMEAAAWNLPELTCPQKLGEDLSFEDGRVVEIWFLTGKRFWYQTAFCAWTFAKHSRHIIRPVLLDDGTLDEPSLEGLRRLFPDLIVHFKDDCDKRVEEFLPVATYPNIHHWRNRQILFRKLTDIHAGAIQWRLFFDSDMLFFDNPLEIDEWLLRPDCCLVQKDCWESYGYSRKLTERLCENRLPDAVNIGIFSLNGGNIHWDQVEEWLGVMMREEGSRYNVTQCISAMLMADQIVQILNGEDYKVWPTSPRPGTVEGVLGHYVSDSKPWYFGSAWKRAAEFS